MVIPDLYGPLRPSNNEQESTKNLRYTPRPLDRLSAHIFDECVILMPLFLLLSAPFKSRFYQGMLLERQDEVLGSAFGTIFVAIALFIVYHTICIAYFGTTLGKRLFQMRVVDVWTGQPLSIVRAFGRAAVSALSFFFMGLGFLTVLSNFRRRSIPDLWFESEVVSVKATMVAIPSSREQWLVRLVYGFVGGFFGAVLVGMIGTLAGNAEGSDLSTWLMDRGPRCEAVDDAMTNWPRPEGEKEDRMKVSLAMYAAGLIDRSCLRAEADVEATISRNLNADYYLAQSFVHSDDPEVSDNYLSHVCKKDTASASCQLSRIVAAWGQEDEDSVSDAITAMENPDVASSIWAIRNFMKRGDPETAYQWLERISPNKPLASFLEVQRTKALWLMNRTAEARISALHGLETLPDDLQTELASWMCVQETSVDCGAAKSMSCQWLKDRDIGTIEEEDPVYNVAMLRTKECTDGDNLNYMELSNATALPSWQILIRGIAKIKAGEKKIGRALLHEVISDDETPSMIRTEAYNRYYLSADDSLLSHLDIQDIPKNIWREIRPSMMAEMSRRNMSEVASQWQEQNERLPKRLPASSDEPDANDAGDEEEE